MLCCGWLNMACGNSNGSPITDHRPSTIRKLLSTGPAARMRSPVLPSSAAVPWNIGGTVPKEPLVHRSRGAGSASGKPKRTRDVANTARALKATSSSRKRAPKTTLEP